MRLPKQDSATGRGIKTAIQAIVGFSVTFGGALILAIKGVPGCPEAIIKVVADNFILLAGSIGVSSGMASFVWNFFRSKVRNY